MTVPGSEALTKMHIDAMQHYFMDILGGLGESPVREGVSRIEYLQALKD